jgi:tripeptidyl-peptidase-1
VSSHATQGVVQQTNKGFAYNGESNLDLEYGMGLVGKTQPVTLYQVGDLTMGMPSHLLFLVHTSHGFLCQALPSTTSLTPSTPPTAPLTEGMTPLMMAGIRIQMDTVSA